MGKEAITVDPLTRDAMAAVSRVAAEAGIAVLVIGATARSLLLEGVYGLEAGRRTLDVDYAIAVHGWEDDRRLRQALTGTGEFVQNRQQAQRLLFRDVVTVDVVPFGGVEDEHAVIEWPDDDGVRMSVLGLSDLVTCAIPVELGDGLVVPVISPEGLLASKIVAWTERHLSSPGRDAADIGYVIRNAVEITGEETLFEDHFETVDAANYELPLAAMLVLGNRLGSVLSSGTRTRLCALIEAQCHADSALVRDLKKFGRLVEPQGSVRLLQAFLQGVNEAL